MIWRWLVNGLGGMVGMLLNTQADGPPITQEKHEQLLGYIRQLQVLADELKQRDLDKLNTEEEYDGFD